MATLDSQLPATTSAQVGRTDEPRKALTGYTPTPDEKKLIDKIAERIHWTGRDNARWALERQMFETIAFYCGIQWIEYSDTTRRFARWNAPNWFPTPVTNLMSPRVGIMQAGLARSQPQGRVRPNTNEPGDYMAAKVAEKLIGHFYDVTKEDMLRDKASLMAALTGTVVAEDIFNPRAGRLLAVPRLTQEQQPVTEPAAQCQACGATADLSQVGMGCPTCGAPEMSAGEQPRTWPDGTPIRTSRLVPEVGDDGQPVVDLIPEGEIESRVRSLMNFYWDQKGTDLGEARWCGEAMYVDLDVIDEMFPELGAYVGSEEGVDSMNFYEASLLSLVGPSIQGTAHYGGSLYFRHGAVLRKYQEKPSKQNPQGINAITAGGVLLHSGPLPIVDEHGEVTGDFSYTEFRYDVVPGRFAGRTPAEDMVPLQKRVNGIDAQVILNRKTMLSPWVLAPKGSGLDPARQYMRPGATVLYNFVGVGAAPQVVPGTPLPQQIMEERAQAIQAMDQLAQDAAGLAQKDMPAGVKSGIAMNFAKEAKEEVTIPRLKRWGAWIAERDRKRLLLSQAYYREPRVVKLLGVGNEWQARLFRGSDLRGNTDVSVDPGTLIWRSQSAKQQAIMDATEAGLIDVQDQVQKQKLIEELGIANFDTPIGPDRRRALKENAQMDDGEQVEMTPVDDHQVHIAEHIARIKDPSFDELPDMARQAHMGHLQAHQQAVQEAQQAADQAQEEKLQRRIMLAAQAKNEGLEALVNQAERSMQEEQAAAGAQG
jgi:hypothetical protein